MKNSDGIENPVMREFIYQFVPNILNNIPFFTKVFGKRFAEERIKAEILRVFTDCPNKMNGYSGFHRDEDKSITISFSGENGKALEPKDVLNSKRLEETVVHEVIHGVLQRTKKECQELEIDSGTGLLQVTEDSKTGEKNEIGRGLNEGYTVWLCEKTGRYNSSNYNELKNFIYLIETIIGTENTMELGKGNIVEQFMTKLNITEKDALHIISMADYLYRVNQDLYIAKNIKDIIERVTKAGDKEMPEELEEDCKDAAPFVGKIAKDPDYLYYLESEGLENTYKNFYKYLSEQYIPSLQDSRQFSIISFESSLLEKSFAQDIKNIYESNLSNMTREDYIKLFRIVSLLQSSPKDIPPFISNLRNYYISLNIKQGFEKFFEKFMKEYAIRQAEKYKQGELSFKEFIEDGKEVFGDNKLVLRYIREFSGTISPDFRKELINLLNYGFSYFSNEEVLDVVENSKIYRLKSEDPSNITTTAIVANGKLFDYFGQYEVDTDIMSRQIAVQDGENISFYYSMGGNNIPLSVEQVYETNFAPRKKQIPEEELALANVSVSVFAKIKNMLRKKWADITNKKPSRYINYYNEVPGKIEFSRRSLSTVELNRVVDFNDRIISSQKREKDTYEKGENDKDNLEK